MFIICFMININKSNKRTSPHDRQPLTLKSILIRG